MEVSGKVIHGQGFAGLAFGVPTANVALDRSCAIGPGVYAAHCLLGAHHYNAVVYVGTVAHEKFEVHLLGFKGDLYGRTLDIKVLQKLSERVPWVSEEQMRAKILNDMKLANDYFSTAGVTLDKTPSGL